MKGKVRRSKTDVLPLCHAIYYKDVRSTAWWSSMDHGEGCRPKMYEEVDPIPDWVRNGCTVTDGLVAVIDDCCIQPTSDDVYMGRVSSNGSIPGLDDKISSDPTTLRKVTSKSVDNSCIMTWVSDIWVSEIWLTVFRALTASDTSFIRTCRYCMLHFACAYANVLYSALRFFWQQCHFKSLRLYGVAHKKTSSTLQWCTAQQ